jgi:predicted nucleic acid-binding Zn ribbon protein
VLNKHLYNYNLCLSKLCDHCDGNKIEDAEHYLLKCSRYTTPRITLLLNVKLIICPDINITLLRDLCPTLAIMICFSYKLRVHLNFSYSYLIIIHNDHQREREREICLVLYYNIVLSFLFINLHYFVLFTMLLYLSMLRRTTSSFWLYVILRERERERDFCLVLYYIIVLSFLFINLYSFGLFMMLLYLSMLRRTTSSLWLYVILMK